MCRRSVATSPVTRYAALSSTVTIPTIAEAERRSGAGQLNGRIPVILPALTVSVGEMLDSLRRVAGNAVADRVTLENDPAIEAIVASWPARFDGARVASLGLQPDPDIDSVIRQYLDDHPQALAP